MEENKYYTPSIEEFHVGFEFQKWEVHDLYYQTLIMQDTTSLIFIKERLQEIRVKYLDNKDIEELGFINWTVEWTDPARYYFTKSLSDGSESIKKGIQLFFIFGSYNRDRVTIYNYVDNNKIILFDGVIKNKSELKVLLKQLQII